MNEEERQKFNRHMAQPEEFEIDGDAFVIKPLDFEYMPELLTAFKLFENVDGPEDLENIMEYMTDEILDACKEIVFVSICESYPELSDDEVNRFCSQNFFQILGAVLRCNQPNVDEEKIEEVKDKLDELRDEEG